MKYIALVYLVAVAFMSLAAFIAYGFDKRRARLDGWRVPEKTLHWMALLGGWPGALAGQRVFRHKTQKLSFRIVLWLCVAFHLLLLAGALYLWILAQ